MCRHVAEPQKHDTECKKPGPKGHMSQDSISMKYPE